MSKAPDSSSKTAPSQRGQLLPAPASYELALAELEQLVAAMEGGQLPLDQLLDNYRRGAELLGFCRERLVAVEQQVKLLDAGELKLWEDS